MTSALHVSKLWLDPLAVAVLLVLALVLGFALSRIFRRYEQSYSGSWLELLFALLSSFPIPLLLLAVLYAGLERFALPLPWERLGSKLILAGVLMVLFYFPARIVALGLRRAAQRDPALARVTVPATFFIRLLFALVAIVILLENLGIHLTAIWTTLGVGSVAVALALQETLSNLFAGLYILADRPINTGDYIRVDSGAEGFVLRIGWRSTSLRTGQNNLVVIPNAALSKAVITNYSMPEDRLTLAIPISVDSGTNPRRVVQVLQDVAEQAAQEGLSGLLSDPRPVARLIPGFGPSSLDFTLYVQVARFADQGPVQDELRQRVWERFGSEGISMPSATTTLVLNESAPPNLLRAPQKNRGTP